MIALPTCPPEDEPLHDGSPEGLLRAGRRADRRILALAADPGVKMGSPERELAKRMALASLRHASDPNTLAVMKLEKENAELAERLDRMAATCFVLNSRLSVVETRVGAPVAPSIGEDWVSAKDACFLTGCSRSAVHQWVRKGKIIAKRLGGRILIDRRSLPVQKNT